MTSDFTQVQWNDRLEDAMNTLAATGIREDLESGDDWTTAVLVPTESRGRGTIVARKAGVIAGCQAGPAVLNAIPSSPKGSTAKLKATWKAICRDGDAVAEGDTVAVLDGCAREILIAERTILNIMCHLSGIATLTQRYVNQLTGLPCAIYDTRKTLPGWRGLQKFAVRLGGGKNHRLGLSAAILIKDNHLHFGAEATQGAHFTPAEAVERAHRFRRQLASPHDTMPIEIEVDSPKSLENVLAQEPDIVLLDNMSLTELQEAVEIRNRMRSTAVLEASGGVNLDTVRSIAETGVERISVGAITHSAPSLDLALDW